MICGQILKGRNVFLAPDDHESNPEFSENSGVLLKKHLSAGMIWHQETDCMGHLYLHIGIFEQDGQGVWHVVYYCSFPL